MSVSIKKVALIIIYNHQYNKNIEISEAIYNGRFSNIYHLVPFYNGDRSNVIPVYDNSFYFQGYVAQGFKKYFHEEFSHYFFVADDLILNPVINEINYAEYLNLHDKSSFLSGFISLHETKVWWGRVKQAFQYQLNIPGVESANQLPPYHEAIRKFQKFKLDIKPLRFSQIWKWPTTMTDLALIFYKDMFYFFRLLYSKLFHVEYHLKYPMVGSYSDVFVVHSDTLKEFCHYCGVFAATELFVEIALPTSLVLSADEIVTETQLKLRGKALWTSDDYKILEKFEGQLDILLNNFPSDCLYLHPIKLSQWKINTPAKPSS